MNAKENIDEYIAKADDWRGGYMKKIRGAVLAVHPEIIEEWKWNCPIWSYKGHLCSVGLFKQHVKCNFFQGASFNVPSTIFNNGLEAKRSRAIDFKEGDSIDVNVIQELVKEAIKFNELK